MVNLDAPVPHSTWEHTYDFNCTYMGVCLVDGECKGESKLDTKSAVNLVLVLHLVGQPAYNKTGLSMLTTNESLTLYEVFKDCETQ